MSELTEDQHLEMVLDHVPYLSLKGLDEVIRVACAWQILNPHYEPCASGMNVASNSGDADDTQ